MWNFPPLQALVIFFLGIWTTPVYSLDEAISKSSNGDIIAEESVSTHRKAELRLRAAETSASPDSLSPSTFLISTISAAGDAYGCVQTVLIETSNDGAIVTITETPTLSCKALTSTTTTSRSLSGSVTLIPTATRSTNPRAGFITDTPKIVGGVIGGIAALILLLIGVWIFAIRKKSSQPSGNPAEKRTRKD